MNRHLHTLSLALVCALPILLTGTIAFAQGEPAAAPPIVAPADPAPSMELAITEGGEPVIVTTDPITPPEAGAQVGIFLARLVLQYPWVGLLITFIGTNRLWAKLAQVAIRKWVASTPSKADDQFLDRVQQSWWYSALGFLVDYLTSIKLPPQREPKGYRTGGITGTNAVLGLALCIGLMGCQSDPETVAFKSIASIQATVKTSMDAWADHVVARRAEIAKLPSSEQVGPRGELFVLEGRVVKALEEYKAAARAAKAGVDAAIAGDQAPATAGMIAAATAYTTLIADLIH